MTTGLLIYILFLHFLADFVFQSDEMAKGKSKSLKWLAEHIKVYAPVLNTGLLLTGINPLKIAAFVLLNAAVHFVIDAITSRVNSRLYAAGWIHEFFIGIGLDQFIHAATLLYTVKYLC